MCWDRDLFLTSGRSSSFSVGCWLEALYLRGSGAERRAEARGVAGLTGPRKVQELVIANTHSRRRRITNIWERKRARCRQETFLSLWLPKLRKRSRCLIRETILETLWSLRKHISCCLRTRRRSSEQGRATTSTLSGIAPRNSMRVWSGSGCMEGRWDGMGRSNA